MAIAFHAAADLGNNGGGSGLTASYTCGSGTNRLLVVSIEGDVSGGADDITSVTYAGVAMTLAAKNTTGTSGNFTRILYIYFLLAPASGANNVIITTASSHYILAQAADYTGVQQSAQPDATAVISGAASLPQVSTLTTVANNCWTVLTGPAQTCTVGPTAGTGAVLRATETAFHTNALFDSGAAITPAGSTSMTVTGTSAHPNVLFVMVSFAPDTGGGGTNVNLAAATATGAVAGLTPSIGTALSAATATGAVAALTPTIGTSVSLAAAAAAGAVGSLTPKVDAILVGVAATGAVGAFTPSTGATVSLPPIIANGAAAAFTETISSNVTLVAVSATGAVAAFTPYIPPPPGSGNPQRTLVGVGT